MRFAQNNIEYRADFFIYIKPKLSNIIERFQYYGHPLEGYLYKTFRGQFLTFINNHNNERKENAFAYQENYDVLNTQTHIIESYQECNMLFYEGTLYHGINLETIIQLFRDTPYFKSFKRRFWMLLVKYSTFLDDSRCYELAEQVDIYEPECQKTLEMIKVERGIYYGKKELHIKSDVIVYILDVLIRR